MRSRGPLGFVIGAEIGLVQAEQVKPVDAEQASLPPGFFQPIQINQH